jgi:hypothetical protein
MSINPDETPRPETDQGVTVGAADARADEQRATGDNAEGDLEDFTADQAAAETTDQGVPVGAADADEDRRRASGDA